MQRFAVRMTFCAPHMALVTDSSVLTASNPTQMLEPFSSERA
jgi:hypothetical protein